MKKEKEMKEKKNHDLSIRRRNELEHEEEETKSLLRVNDMKINKKREAGSTAQQEVNTHDASRVHVIAGRSNDREALGRML